MTTAELVNRIVEKLGGDRVTFLTIGCNIWFEFGSHQYCTDFVAGRIQVWPADNDKKEVKNKNDYSRLIEVVLNGMVRNDAGELVEGKDHE